MKVELWKVITGIVIGIILMWSCLYLRESYIEKGYNQAEIDLANFQSKQQSVLWLNPENTTQIGIYPIVDVCNYLIQLNEDTK